jgi:hypothetical protein
MLAKPNTIWYSRARVKPRIGGAPRTIGATVERLLREPAFWNPSGSVRPRLNQMRSVRRSPRRGRRVVWVPDFGVDPADPDAGYTGTPFHAKCWSELTERSPAIETRISDIDWTRPYPERFGSPLTSDDVIAWFDKTGVPLVLQGRTQSLLSILLNDRRFERIRFLDPASDAEAEFGVDVLESPEDAAQEVAFISEEAGPDPDGIHWRFSAPEHRGDSSSWLAATAYENVVLYWWPTEKRTDSRWDRVDASLNELARASASRT